jgi:uncharacterized protein with HEPN domain
MSGERLRAYIDHMRMGALVDIVWEPVQTALPELLQKLAVVDSNGDGSVSR